jgi:glutamine amidotransferase
MREIAILDYGIGNVKSIFNALDKINVAAVLTADKDKILNADGLILPGVGAFAQGMENLAKANLPEVIKEFVSTGKPFLGICLGMQMLMGESEEFGTYKGLGLIPGKVKKITFKNSSSAKLPHVSWNELNSPTLGRWDSSILDKIPENADVYFVHSFVVKPENPNDLLANTNYNGEIFCSAVQRDNIYGVQFHPEKSGIIGLNILKNFVKLTENEL